MCEVCVTQSYNLNQRNQKLDVEPIVAPIGATFDSTIGSTFFHSANGLEACKKQSSIIPWNKGLRHRVDVVDSQ